MIDLANIPICRIHLSDNEKARNVPQLLRVSIATKEGVNLFKYMFWVPFECPGREMASLFWQEPTLTQEAAPFSCGYILFRFGKDCVQVGILKSGKLLQKNLRKYLFDGLSFELFD